MKGIVLLITAIIDILCGSYAVFIKSPELFVVFLVLLLVIIPIEIGW